MFEQAIGLADRVLLESPVLSHLCRHSCILRRRGEKHFDGADLRVVSKNSQLADMKKKDDMEWIQCPKKQKCKQYPVVRRLNGNRPMGHPKALQLEFEGSQSNCTVQVRHHHCKR